MHRPSSVELTFALKGKTVSPEYYTTAWGWASFRWMLPLLERGLSKTLNEEDVWSISPLQQARPLYILFSRSTGTLLRKLWNLHYIELFLDIVLTWLSVVFSYAGPVFLKLILDALAQPGKTREQRALAFVYALLAFACKLLQVCVHRVYW